MKADNSLESSQSKGRSIDRIWYKSRAWLSDPTIVFGLVLSAIFAYLVLAPVLLMLFDAVIVDFADQARAAADTGTFTLYYFKRALFSPVSFFVFWKPLLNTAIVAVCVIVITLIIGGILGWLVSRTNLLGKQWFSTALIVPYMVPSWTFALAWLAIAGIREDVVPLACAAAAVRYRRRDRV